MTNCIDPRHPARRRSRRAAASLAVQARWKQQSVSSIPTENKNILGSRIMYLQNLSAYIAKISEYSSLYTGVCHMIEEVHREGLASILLVQCDKCSKKFHMVSSQKVKNRYE